MSKSPSDSFILELPLKVSSHETKELDIRFEAGRHLYNACLGECLKRIALIRQSKEWSKGRSLEKRPENTKNRRDLFQQAQKKYAFSEYSLHAFVGNLRNNCWVREHVDSLTAQKVATNAFQSAMEYLVGKRGRPRFKAKGRYRSLEGKNNSSGIRFKEGQIVWGLRGKKPLVLHVLYDRKDKFGVQAHALQCRTKYVRLVRKVIRGRERWYAQLVQEGKALLKAKNRLGQSLVGLDIGPSTIAVVSDASAELLPFCEGLEQNQAEIAKLQKKLDRSRRKTNPRNFEENGTVKKGAKKWVRSNRYKKLANQAAESQRRLAETRKRFHGELTNKVIRLGIFIKTEKLSYRQLQQDFGKSVGFRAPGMFVSLLRRKAESAGGFLEEFSTYKTKLSQVCQCGRRQKKALSNRWHQCECGIGAQRDLFSAHLARFVNEDQLDTRQAREVWPAAEPLLERAVSSAEQRTKGKHRFSSFGLGQRQSPSHAKGGSLSIEAVDVVGICREPQRAGQFAFRTPWL